MSSVSLDGGSAVWVLAVNEGNELAPRRWSLRLPFGSRGAAVPPGGLFFGRHMVGVVGWDLESVVECRWMDQLPPGMALSCETLL